MWLLFIDEFGHPGHSKDDQSYHPAFGYAGVLVSSNEFDRLSNSFLTFKAIAVRDGLPAFTKRGNFNFKALKDRSALRIMKELDTREILKNADLENGKSHFKSRQSHNLTDRLLKLIIRSQAKIFLVGVEKGIATSQPNTKAPNLLIDLLEELVDRAAMEARAKQEELLIIFDKHSSDAQRAKKIEDRIKIKKHTRFIRKSPAFSDSTWSQGIQIADWLCFLAGRIMGNHCQERKSAYAPYAREYGEVFEQLLSQHSIFRCAGNVEIRGFGVEQLPLPAEKS